MLELTSKTHQDFLSTFSLSRARSTDLVIKVMTEVKIREDEYNLIKRFSTRIQGLSASSQLATRDRRLLQSGPPGLVISDRGPTRAKRNSGFGNKSTAESKRSSELAGVYATGLMMLRNLVLPNLGNLILLSLQFLLVALLLPQPQNPPGFLVYRFGNVLAVNRLSLVRKLHLLATFSLFFDVSLQCIPIHAFVINDLVLLAQSKSPSDDDPLWVLIRDLGIIKPLSIAHINAQNLEGIRSVYLYVFWTSAYTQS